MATLVLSEVRGEPLSALVLRTLREAIVEGRLAPGETVVEAQLSRQLGVSRAPLREALRSLENEGLIVSVPWRGAFVAPLTERGVTELQAFRRLLEVFAAEQVLAQDAVDVSSLDDLVVEMERCAEAGNLDCMNETDVRFHTRIVEMSGNALLLDVWRSTSPPFDAPWHCATGPIATSTPSSPCTEGSSRLSLQATLPPSGIAIGRMARMWWMPCVTSSIRTTRTLHNRRGVLRPRFTHEGQQPRIDMIPGYP